MLVIYASPVLSIKHAVPPRSVVVLLDIFHCRRIVLKYICIHESLLHSLRCPTCIPLLHCVLFLPCCWCCCSFLVSGWPHSLHPSPLCLFASPSRLAFHPLTTTPCLLTNICSFFQLLFGSPRCITSSPFTLRRASHLKPPKPSNIYYSPSPTPLHCKIYTFPHRSFTTHAPFSPTRP